MRQSINASTMQSKTPKQCFEETTFQSEHLSVHWHRLGLNTCTCHRSVSWLQVRRTKSQIPSTLMLPLLPHMFETCTIMCQLCRGLKKQLNAAKPPQLQHSPFTPFWMSLFYCRLEDQHSRFTACNKICFAYLIVPGCTLNSFTNLWVGFWTKVLFTLNN